METREVLLANMDHFGIIHCMVQSAQIEEGVDESFSILPNCLYLLTYAILIHGVLLTKRDSLAAS